MRQKIGINQTGYALLLMVVALMGLGGAVMTGFTLGVKQQTEHERYLHNQRVLEDAKRALLQYAYNYPQLGPGQDDGPGRLLCPDTDNDGFEDGNIDCIDTTSGAPVAMVGRFPWKDARLNFHEAKDASGEVLWFAVSSNFARGLNSLVNSDTNGTIAIEDRSGALLHPATFAVDVFGAGVAAVIFAPGPAIARDGVVQDRVADDIDPENYLDKFSATVDNATFVNADANDPPDGFVTGPIFNPVDGSLAVNDQMIVITAAEVIAMAEKATLQAYRNSIIAYLDNVACTGETPPHTGITEALCLANTGVWNPVYPWLYNYRDVSNIAELSSLYPAFLDFDDEKDPDLDPNTDDGYLDNYGRIPSIFADYFTETDSQPIETQLSGSITLSASALTTLSEGGGFPGSGDKNFNDGPTLPFDPTQILTGVKFVDLANSGEGRLTTTFPAPEPALSYEVYFWDEDNATQQGWTACPGGADQLIDCVGVSAYGKARILHMTVTLKFEDPSGTGTENFDMDYTPAPAISITPATATAHASITATYAASEVISFAGTITATYEFEEHFHYSDSGENLISLNSGDGSYAAGTVDMTGFALGPLSLGIRYYPELPGWAFTNDWHNSIRMAYADTYLPTLPTDCDPTSDCLIMPEERGNPRNIESLLVIAGEHDWNDDDANGMADELRDVFDNDNDNNDRSFYNKRSISPSNSSLGNDKVLVIQELP